MEYIQQILFAIILGAVGWLIYRRIKLIRDTIRLGQPEDRTDRPSDRLRLMGRMAFGQKKMFDRPLVGIMHFVLYAGFLLINIEVLEIILDGLSGQHRMFVPFFGTWYHYIIDFFELLAVGVIVVCAIFLVRRNILKVNRLQPERHRELRGFPYIDGNVILIFEIVLMCAILTMNAADTVLQDMNSAHYPLTGDYLISQYLKPLFAGWSEGALIGLERGAWWFHILGILAFALYVTHSKHLHIALAFPNTYFARLTPRGEVRNMPEITKEVKLMLGMEQADPNEQPAEIGRFGAKDAMDLSWKNLMDAYSCTECGRCTAQCPANITGKLLSPRKIMMDTRDRLEDLGHNMQANGGKVVEDGKTLLGDYILVEEIMACTTCNACVEACPVMIDPLDIIMQLRRYKIMDEAQAPASWNMMFQNMETSQAPWKFSPSDRFNWANNLRQ
ncbi:(Fe-S)-binding protein [Telluribacter sp. SYSU D00476]|uniref:(Fe-S)-binding protein n=1 Tax=Telluribacter sp. SYSU D00476 TaxID=2811430 RepID=UPI001FF45F3E|nr:(Fe-S)-binding protein [Telluribacter sp. SYSU D00476]